MFVCATWFQVEVHLLHFYFIRQSNRKIKMANKQRLLEKYEVAVENLDFTYIKQCRNRTEVEKMLEILRSGEEGYFPDLTKCAEFRLHELDPNHRMLRTEVQCQRTTQQLDDQLIVTPLVCYFQVSFNMIVEQHLHFRHFSSK